MTENEDWHTDPDLFLSLPGGRAIHEFFGYVPGFHDADLLGLEITPQAVIIRLHAVYITNKTDSNGYLVPDRQAAVTFSLTEVTGFHLTGTSASIVDELRVRQLGDVAYQPDAWTTCGGPETGDYEVEIVAIYGLDGSIFAKGIELALEPLPQASG